MAPPARVFPSADFWEAPPGKSCQMYFRLRDRKCHSDYSCTGRPRLGYATIVSQGNMKVTASPRGIPRCPSCHEPDAIEPLQQIDDVWHVRCLNCSCGFTFEVPRRPTAQERRQREDRRAIARSGRRATDLPRPVTCDGCGCPHVKGWIRTGETLWARCTDCGRAQRVATEVLV